MEFYTILVYPHRLIFACPRCEKCLGDAFDPFVWLLIACQSVVAWYIQLSWKPLFAY